jgi:hypothetical protein
VKRGERKGNKKTETQKKEKGWKKKKTNIKRQ